MQLTANLLICKEAPDWVVNRFKELFGESVIITRELCIKNANTMIHDWDWLKHYSFSSQYQGDVYNKAKSNARSEYRSHSFILYGEAIYARESEEKCNTLWYDFIARDKIAYPVYCKSMAIAFADAALGGF